MIVVIAGTNRPHSNTLKVARLVENTLHECGEKVSLVDLSRLPAELFAPSSYATKPPGEPGRETVGVHRAVGRTMGRIACGGTAGNGLPVPQRSPVRSAGVSAGHRQPLRRKRSIVRRGHAGPDQTRDTGICRLLPLP
jgi:hypothetical protein